MKMRNRFVTIICVGFLLLGAACSNSKVKSSPVKSSDTQPQVSAPSAEALKGQVWVSKADGSKSCGMQGGMTPEQAVAEFKKAAVKVHAKRAGRDGMMHMMVCGAATGNTVEVLIDGENYEVAQKLGYQVK
jgi:hypothetical protein